MKLKRHEIIEHTADIGIRARGKNLKELFINSALGMFGIIARRRNKTAACQDKKEKNFTLSLTANNEEELLVAWLGELLSLSNARNLIFTRFIIEKLTAKKLKAKAGAQARDKGLFALKTEIKAVTYSGLKIEKNKGYLQAEVIFDV